MRFPIRLLGCWVVAVGLFEQDRTCDAAVAVFQNVAPGATSWAGSPILATVTNPSLQATVAESFNGGGGNTNLSQTFAIPSGTNFSGDDSGLNQCRRLLTSSATKFTGRTVAQRQ